MRAPETHLLRVNGVEHRVEGRPDTPLIYALRNDLALNSPKFGCGLGECGACTVLLDGAAARSCALPLGQAAGREIVTLEGLAGPEGADAHLVACTRSSRPSSTSRPPSAATASAA